MARRAHPTARVRLARSLPRLLGAPLLLFGLAAALAVGGLLVIGGTAGLAIAAAGGLLVVLGGVAAAAALSVRVDIEESLVRVSWLFGRRIYLLTPGSLTRAYLRGENASRLRTGLPLGWRVGSAVLRDEEEIHVVRLAPTASLILVPTARGRLGIATSNEPHLIEALTRAAQARARAEELPEVVAPPLAAPEPVVGTPTTRRIFRRPSWARRRPSMPSLSMPSLPSLPSVSMPTVSMPALPDRVRALPIRRPRPSWLVLLLPLAAAAAVWGAGVYLDRIPVTGTDTARLTVLALILAGPATTIGAVMARTWWPRIVGVVVMGGLVACVFIGRALLAG